MKAIVDDDIVLARASGDVSGVPIPDLLLSLPDDRLRCVEGSIVDAADTTEWFVDDVGRKRLADADGRFAISCSWDARLVKSRDGWRVATAQDTLSPAIKAECRRRILAVVNETAQINLAAAAAGDSLSPADLVTYKAGLDWIAAMRTKCRDLIVAGDDTYKADDHWPVPSQEIIALAAAF